MTNFYKNKKVLVTGSEGMIGKELCELLEKEGAKVMRFDIKISPSIDITDKDYCELVLLNLKPDYIFHLFGIKGSPKMTKERPVDFMGPMLQGDVNMILAAQKYGVKRFLYTSSIAVENPETDRFPAWAKMTGETLIEAMRTQYPCKYAMDGHLDDTKEEHSKRTDYIGTKWCIVRPANCYGKYDNFDNPNAMVVTKLIKQALTGKIILDNEGSKQYRDFINAKDVALGMMKAIEEMPDKPVNLCSGNIYSIENLVLEIKGNLKVSVEYKDLNLVLGPQEKSMKRNWDNPLTVSLEEGIKEVCDYVRKR